MRKSALILLLVLLTTLFSVPAALASPAAVISVRNFTQNNYFLSYDTWVLGIRTSHRADLKPNGITDVTAPFLESFGEMRIFKIGVGGQIWSGQPSGEWLPTRSYTLLINGNETTSFILKDRQ